LPAISTIAYIAFKNWTAKVEKESRIINSDSNILQEKAISGSEKKV
jgi:hypothetical protein